eukprot:5573731-Pyramimonas_sp.AAC.1
MPETQVTTPPLRGSRGGASWTHRCGLRRARTVPFGLHQRGSRGGLEGGHRGRTAVGCGTVPFGLHQRGFIDQV